MTRTYPQGWFLKSSKLFPVCLSGLISVTMNGWEHTVRFHCMYSTGSITWNFFLKNSPLLEDVARGPSVLKAVLIGFDSLDCLTKSETTRSSSTQSCFLKHECTVFMMPGPDTKEDINGNSATTSVMHLLGTLYMLSNFNKRRPNFSSISSFNSSVSYLPEQCASAVSSVIFDWYIYLCGEG